ncbi:MAG TPA: succinate dehydrogenase, hydrophobic membrane anchor protein [Xanthomonadaceae bacterium]|nr:succinate dehydrogenase, hydrophobic membrane anchor protein [Xanthomonadaceae bacterium]
MSLRHPLARVHGLGSAKEGVSHWWAQRLTAIALVPLSVWFLVWLFGLISAGPDGARAAIAQPVSAVLLIAFLVAIFWHAQLGMQVVVEDYVHTRWLEITLQIAFKFLAFLGALAGIVAVLRIAIAG